MSKGGVAKNFIAGRKEAKASDATTAEVLQRERDEQLLKQFDLSSKYGPCIGMTRLERWERAKKLELCPPQEVYDILHKACRSESAAQECKENKCIWEGRV